MATTKKPSKTAAPKKTGTSLDTYREELAGLAATTAKTAASAGGGSAGIKTRGGIFTIEGQDAGRTLNAIILEGVLENAYYGGEGFDPDNPKNPVAFAIGEPGQKADELVWHPDSIEPYAGELCKESDINQWGSADKGRGKAAKNIARLMVIAADDLDDIEGSEARMLKIPVTSVKNWAGYVQQLKAVSDLPTLAVATEIELVPHPKHQFEMKFKLIEEVDGEYIPALLAKRKATLDDLMRPYSPQTEEEAPAGKGAGKALAKGASRGSQQPAKAATARRR